MCGMTHACLTCLHLCSNMGRRICIVRPAAHHLGDALHRSIVTQSVQSAESTDHTHIRCRTCPQADPVPMHCCDLCRAAEFSVTYTLTYMQDGCWMSRANERAHHCLCACQEVVRLPDAFLQHTMLVVASFPTAVAILVPFMHVHTNRRYWTILAGELVGKNCLFWIRILIIT